MLFKPGDIFPAAEFPNRSRYVTPNQGRTIRKSFPQVGQRFLVSNYTQGFGSFDPDEFVRILKSADQFGRAALSLQEIPESGCRHHSHFTVGVLELADQRSDCLLCSQHIQALDRGRSYRWTSV